MIVLPYLSIIRATGVDAGAFLHGQLSADLTSLSSGQCCFATYCNPQGQVIALLLVCRQESDFLLICEAGLASTVIQRLGMYVLRARVSFEPLNRQCVLGLKATELVPDDITVCAPGGTSLRYALSAACPASEDPSIATWRTEEILHGIAWLQPATSGRFLPQMLGLDAIGAVSFNKGCYPGQEIIARIRYLGKIKRHPVLLQVTGHPNPAPGTPCLLHSGDLAIEAMIVEIEGGSPDVTSMLVVAPVEVDKPVERFEADGKTWPARRLHIGDGVSRSS